MLMCYDNMFFLFVQVKFGYSVVCVIKIGRWWPVFRAYVKSVRMSLPLAPVSDNRCSGWGGEKFMELWQNKRDSVPEWPGGRWHGQRTGASSPDRSVTIRRLIGATEHESSALGNAPVPEDSGE